MTDLTPARRALALALAALLTLILAACAGSSGPSAAPSGDPAPSVDPGPAVDLDTLVGDGVADGDTVHVTGFFLASGDVAQICSLVLESYPPQCGGTTLRITGEVPAEVMDALESTNDPALAQATWGQVEVTGTYRATGAGGMPTIELGTIAVVEVPAAG